MDIAIKNGILKRYLKQISASPESVDLSNEALAPYAALARQLDYIETHHNNLFDFATLLDNEQQWKSLTSILNFSNTFTPGSPPTLTGSDDRKAHFGIRYWHNANEISRLPRDNYYARTADKPAVADVELTDLVVACRNKLYLLTQSVPAPVPFNPANNTEVTARISTLETQLKALAVGHVDRAPIEKQLLVLADLNKINQLKQMDIPKDDGSVAKYCTLAEAAGGVTEKVSLITLVKTKAQLTQLRDLGGLTLDNFKDNQGQFKLSTQAILKLPKHGKIEEVQREAMALNISRMMGLETTASTAVSYNGKPALFVPFDTIRLLNDFSSGKTFTAGLGIQGQTYTHYSTIKPVGEGMQADRFVNDFGNALGLMYLCSDTDAVGGYAQNKALKNARSLFIFDQVVMDSHKFILDSRMSLQPDQFFLKHTRHGQGRNRTLIEDSSFTTKYASIMQLKTLSEKIAQYADSVAYRHKLKAEELNGQLRGQLTAEARAKITAELKDVMALESDAKKIKTQMQERIDAINNVLPKTEGAVTSDEVRQALILEKLTHNPVLFSDDGRPYKNPWTNRQTNPVQSVKDLGDGRVQIQFKSKVPADKIDFIKRHGGGASMTLTSPKVITMSKAHLNQLSEDMLHPEHTLNLNPATDYLATADLAVIKEAYGKGHRTQIIDCITEYKTAMNNPRLTAAEKIEHMNNTKAAITTLIGTAKDKGLGMHVLKKLHFDEQQQLQKLINPLHIPARLNEAFAAALKLDKASEFNQVMKEAIKLNKVRDPQFLGYLDACINREAAATNHSEAQIESLALSGDARAAIAHFNAPVIPIIVQLDQQQDGLLEIDPLAHLALDLSDEQHRLMAPPSSPVDAPVIRDAPKDDGITLSS